MEQQANVDVNGATVHYESDVCHICECNFSLDDEGGACGHLGVLFVAFCPTCHAALYDMYTNWYGADEEGKIVLLEDIKLITLKASLDCSYPTALSLSATYALIEELK